MPRETWHDCEAIWDETSLTLKNSAIERRWRLENGLLYNVSLRNARTGTEYLVATSDHPSPTPEFPVAQTCRHVTVVAGPWQPEVVGARGLRVTVRAAYDDYDLTTVLMIYPATPAISTQLEIATHVADLGREEVRSAAAGALSGVEAPPTQPTDAVTDVNEQYRVDHIHRVLGIGYLMDHTDNQDNLAHVRRDLLTIAQLREYQGNVFYLENQLTQEGLVFLKEAPLPYARPVPAAKDLTVRGGQLTFTGLGAGDAAVRASYPLTTLVYAGGRAGRIRALQDYQRQLRQLDVERDVIIWHNNWGDRNKDSKMSEAFLLAELEAIAEVGIDQLHPDDGWEKGVTSNSIVPGGRWQNQWADPDFWQPHPERLPRGWAPIVAAAREKGIKLGLWYNVDAYDDYANWEKDVAVLLALHRDWGFSYFKFDAIRFTSKKGEENLLKAMRGVVEGSQGRASILLDATAGIRPGYFQGMPYGFIFLENRYTDWHKYWPHTTMRNLWQLAEFVDPRRLVVEYLNNERNQDKYAGDPLAPGAYSPDYLFATVMFANPLSWFEASCLSAAYKSSLKEIIAAYKPHRAKIARGNIFPIGEEPSGLSWTGFQSQIPGEPEGYMVVFREWTERPAGTFQLAYMAPGRYRFTALAGRGSDFTAEVDDTGAVTVALPEKQSYGFYLYRQER